MRNHDSAPGRGLRSVELWRRLAAARRALESEPAGGEPRALDDVLREAGIDEHMFDVARAQLAPPERAPAPPVPDESAEAELAVTQGCVVRSSSGRISLKVVPT
jgi:hypothetical protein